MACSEENKEKNIQSSEDVLELTEEQVNKSNFCGAASFDIPNEPAEYKGYDLKVLEENLGNKGIQGYMHGAIPQYSYYVLNYGPTLNAIQFNLITFDQEIKAQLKDLKRHDKINIKGYFLENRSPVKHIVVSNLEIIESYEHRDDYNYEYKNNVLEDFSQNESKKILAKVHAVIADGKALILDYKDAIIPVFIDPQHYKLTADLYRNDKVMISVKPLAKSRGPLHLTLDQDIAKPITVIDNMVNCHGKLATIEGVLTMFYKSPQISLNVFAVKQTDPNGLERNFTFFPDYSARDELDKFMKLFSQIGEKLTPIWDQNEENLEHGRNSLFNHQIKIRVTGKMNVISKGQANPQIYIKNVEAIEVIEN